MDPLTPSPAPPTPNSGGEGSPVPPAPSAVSTTPTPMLVTPPAETPAPAAAATPPSASTDAAAYTIEVPEGNALNPEGLAAYTTVAHELGLTQAQAQGVINRMAPLAQAGQAAQLEAQSAAWAASAQADPDYGGPKLQESLGFARKALAAFGDAELTTYLNASRVGNMPAMIRFMVKAGKAIATDHYVGGRAPGTSSKPLSNADYADKLYATKET